MAKSFTVITSKPTKSSKYIYLYNNAKNGGKSYCINGNNTDSVCNVLCNCVGWACGRFNHIYNVITGFDGIKYPNFCCNAENFIEVAKNYGLKTGDTPKPGAIMVWQKGTLASSDGAGHVAIVEKVISSYEVLTSESGWSSTVPMWNQNRVKGTGNWGMGSSFTFRAFIYNPAVQDSTTSTKKESTTVSITSPVSKSQYSDQLYIKISNLNVRVSPSTSAKSLGYAISGYYNYYETKISGGYTWYRIAENQWVAYNANWENICPAKKTENFYIGDKVTLTSDAVTYGTSKRFSSWVYNATLYVRSVSGDRVVVSTQVTGDVTGAVNKKYLIKK